MKVNHFNTYPHGGAANAALRIHQGLLDQGVDSTFLYRLNEKKPPENPSVQPVQFAPQSNPSGILKPFYQKLEKRRRKTIHRLYDTHLANRAHNEHEVFSMARLPELTPLDWERQPSDIVHLHWLAFLADHPSFFASIPDNVPVVWTLHDMSAFTGGCHYAAGCDRFQQACGHCPQINAASSSDVSADSIRAKTKSLRNKLMHVVAPSSWLIELAKQSPIWPDSTKFSVIHYGLNLAQFQPAPKSIARQQLGIRPDKVVVGFGADDLGNPRKGFAYLTKALESISAETQGLHPKIELAVFGAGAVPKNLLTRFQVHNFGFVADQQDLANIYSACDFVVVPSLEDNQPQVGLEAMACGRPVVGFGAGGIPEYVINQETGILVSPKDSESLANTISKLSDDRAALDRMGTEAGKLVRREFETSRQSSKYSELYQSLIQTSSRKPAAA